MAEIPHRNPVTGAAISKVLVIKTEQMDEVVAFFESLGFDATKEKHGKGPTHFSFTVNDRTFEVYPSKSGDRVFFVEEK